MYEFKQQIRSFRSIPSYNYKIKYVTQKTYFEKSTIVYMASNVQYNNVILQNLQKLKGLEHFNWRELKHRVSEYGISQTSDRVTAKSSMLSEDQCNIIL